MAVFKDKAALSIQQSALSPDTTNLKTRTQLTIQPQTSASPRLGGELQIGGAMIPETPSICRYVPGKLSAYEAVYWFNRSLEAVLLSLERLERVGMFRMEYLNEWKIRMEYTRAEANEELTNTLSAHESEESARFDDTQRYWGKLRADPSSRPAIAARKSKNTSRIYKADWSGRSRLRRNRAADGTPTAEARRHRESTEKPTWMSPCLGGSDDTDPSPSAGSGFGISERTSLSLDIPTSAH
jgi:hypothetical protein